MDSLCIFLVTGKTFTFKEVEIIANNETEITFTYVAVSDGLWKTATFYKQHVAGIASLDTSEGDE